MKLALFLTLLCCISSGLGASVQIGTCFLQGTTLDPTITGMVTFTYVAANQVRVDVEVEGITVATGAEHGLHVHEYGDISSTSSTTTGGHWNPASQPHACPDDPARHMGDMGNWTVEANGTISQSKTLDLLTLTGGSSIIGRAVVLHQAFDDCVTQTTGGAGNRLAHCVIGIAAPGAGDTNIATLDDPTLTEAVCVLTNASGSAITGLVVLTQENATAPVRIQAEFFDITGTHGFHIHTYGDVSSPTGGAVGSHYNPLNVHHAIPPYPVRHMGDLGNIVYTVTNMGYYDYTNDMLSLSGEYSIIGRAMIVHSTEDDCSDPVGNSGSRYAQCVIGVKNPSTAVTIPIETPTTQDDSVCDSIYATTSPEGTGTADIDSSFASVTSVAYGLLALALVFAALF